jgi:hypothetical protein
MASGFRPFYIQLLNTRTRQAIDDDAGVCNVLVAGSPVEVTIYTDGNGQVAASNPLTFTNGVVSFWTADTVTSVDLSIMTSSGDACFVTGVTESMHRVDINPDERTQTLVVPFAASNATEVDTGFDFPANCLLSPYGTHLRVTTVDATETIDVGLLSSEGGGDANGFITLASVATAGIVNLIPQITGGTNIDFVSTNFIGALLATSITGADAVATVGGWTPIHYRTDGTAKSITYTGSTGSDTAAGYIYFTYTKLT